MKSVMVNQFKQLPDVDFFRNTFDCSHGYLTTCDAGKLYPVFFDEVVPGDTKSLKSSFFGRINTLIVPGYYNIYMDYQLWYVPNRLIWTGWNAFMGETWNPYGTQNTGNDELIEPQITVPEGGYTRYGLLDYLSIPPAIPGCPSVTAKFARAYNLVWNCFYRSETLQDCVLVPTDNGPDDESLYKILPRGKRFDYLTSSLPQPFRGNQEVYLPVGSSAPTYISNGGKNFEVWAQGDASTAENVRALYQESGNTSVHLGGSTLSGDHTLYYANGLSALTDLSQAVAPSLSAFRTAVATERFLERENRYGDRIKEIIYAHFGVECPDYRLQLPEYLGGCTVRLDVSQVPQTSASADDLTPQANLSAYGTLAHSGSGFYRSFSEHGVILGLVSFRADLQYQQGIDRMFSRKQKFDYMFPEFAGLSDQEVLNKEIYVDGTDADEDVFGYNERYAEYRFRNSYVTSKMRSSDPQSLDVWHLAQYFENRPTLSEDFIVENPPMDRIIAVSDEPVFTLDCFHEYYNTTELPLYGIPGLDKI